MTFKNEWSRFIFDDMINIKTVQTFFIEKQKVKDAIETISQIFCEEDKRLMQEVLIKELG